MNLSLSCFKCFTLNNMEKKGTFERWPLLSYFHNLVISLSLSFLERKVKY